MQKGKKIFLVLYSVLLSSLFAQSYTYDDLFYSVVNNNPELKLLEEEYYRSQLDVKDAYAGLGPTIDLQASGTFMSKPLIDEIYLDVDKVIDTIKFPAGINPQKTGQRIKVYDGMEKTLYNFELSMTQPIFTWGKLSNAVKLYKKVSNIKSTQIESKRLELKTQLKSRLTTFAYLQRINNIIEEEKEYVDRLVKVSENAEKSGMLLHQDVVDAKIQAKELEIAQQDLREELNNQIFELIQLTGIEELKAEEIIFEINEQEIRTILQSDREVVLNNALSGNQLSIKLLNQLKDVSDTSVKIAKGYVNWKPDIALQASISYGGVQFPFIQPEWQDKDDYSANFSIGIRTTLWDGGKKVRDVSRKISESRTAEINQMDARVSIRKTLDEQWNTIDACTIKIEYQDLKIEASDSKIAQKENIYKSGYGSETDVINAKIERCNQQIEKEKQELSRAIACMTIDYLCSN